MADEKKRGFFARQARRFTREVDGEFDRKAVQGAAELGQALFSPSNAYVPYGQGQARNLNDEAAQKVDRSRGREM